jgi:hypothetical protein
MSSEVPGKVFLPEALKTWALINPMEQRGSEKSRVKEFRLKKRVLP